MKNYFLSATVFCAALCTGAPALLSGESFRVHKTVIADAAPDSEPENLIMGINDALCIRLPKDITFIQGIEIDVKIPQIVASWRDSIAWSLFDDISPVPDESKIDYSGTHIALNTLPPRLSWTMVIPLTPSNSLKTTPYVTKLDVIPDTSNGYLFIRLQQAMKGTPDEFGDAEFEVSVKPVLINKGRLTLKLSGPEKPLKPYNIFIDDVPYDLQTGGILTDTGVHTISVVSEFYRSEVRTVRIDQAKNNILAITLRGIEPTIQVSCPENATVFFDDAELKIKDKYFTVTEGEHKIRFVIGDYEVVKTVTAVKGRSYTVALSIDATVTEEE